MHGLLYVLFSFGSIESTSRCPRRDRATYAIRGISKLLIETYVLSARKEKVYVRVVGKRRL